MSYWGGLDTKTRELMKRYAGTWKAPTKPVPTPLDIADEIRAMLEGGNLPLVSDYPDLPSLFPAPEGMEWVEVNKDQYGLPMRNPVWSLKPIDMPEEDKFTLEDPALELAREKFAFEQKQWGAEFGLREKELAWQKQQQKPPTLQELADIFEQFRTQYLAGAGQANWIQRWFAEKMPNPYEEQLARLRGKKKRLQWEVTQSAAELAKQVTGGERAAESVFAERMGETVPRFAEPKKYKRPEPVTGPPAPEWLPQFALGQIAGQPITKAPIRTPSAQALAQMPWSQREMLGGYTEWASGRTLRDITDLMAMMLPETPRGAGYKRWRPARQ